jgi:hypothetical protein
VCYFLRFSQKGQLARGGRHEKKTGTNVALTDTQCPIFRTLSNFLAILWAGYTTNGVEVVEPKRGTEQEIHTHTHTHTLIMSRLGGDALRPGREGESCVGAATLSDEVSAVTNFHGASQHAKSCELKNIVGYIGPREKVVVNGGRLA